MSELWLQQAPMRREPSLGQRMQRCSSAHHDLGVGEWTNSPGRASRERDIERWVTDLETRLPRETEEQTNGGATKMHGRGRWLDRCGPSRSSRYEEDDVGPRHVRQRCDPVTYRQERLNRSSRSRNLAWLCEESSDDFRTLQSRGSISRFSAGAGVGRSGASGRPRWCIVGVSLEVPAVLRWPMSGPPNRFRPRPGCFSTPGHGLGAYSCNETVSVKLA